MVTAPGRWPVAAGVKVTVTVQLAPAAKVLADRLVCILSLIHVGPNYLENYFIGPDFV